MPPHRHCQAGACSRQNDDVVGSRADAAQPWQQKPGGRACIVHSCCRECGYDCEASSRQGGIAPHLHASMSVHCTGWHATGTRTRKRTRAWTHAHACPLTHLKARVCLPRAASEQLQAAPHRWTWERAEGRGEGRAPTMRQQAHAHTQTTLPAVQCM